MEGAMAVNITLDQTEIYKAFKLRQTMDLYHADPGALSQQLLEGIAAQNVKIVPPLADKSNIRRITWLFAYPVVAHDADNIEKLQQIIDAALSPVSAAI